MRKITLSLLTAFMLFVLAPGQLKANAETNTVQTEASATSTTNSAAANARLDRLYEIKAMDISSLSSAEKKELRKEVRSIKGEMKANGETTTKAVNGSGGVYLSVGAIIVIILLLILIL